VGILDAGTLVAVRLGLAAASAVQSARLSTLIFHRVLPKPDALFPQEMDAIRFDRAMALVSRTFQVLPLTNAVERLCQGDLPARALVITFDDGYADNCDIALPILRRHGLHATFFVATGFVDGGRMWNDTVIESLRRTSATSLDLAALGLRQLPLSSIVERRQAIDQVLRLIKYMPPVEREVALERLRVQCGNPQLPGDLMMTSEQVRELHQHGMGIGAHTVNHPILCSLPDHETEAEIGESRSRLEALIGSPVQSFAYPNGRLGKDYDQRHAEMLRRLGFRLAVSTEPGVSRMGDDIFQLKRFTPWDLDPIRWVARLAKNHVRR
jgi:peptidoglycan/xylan/chitin deacetylase (PgdA/CDA1 family)